MPSPFVAFSKSHLTFLDRDVASVEVFIFVISIVVVFVSIGADGGERGGVGSQQSIHFRFDVDVVVVVNSASLSSGHSDSKSPLSPFPAVTA